MNSTHDKTPRYWRFSYIVRRVNMVNNHVINTLNDFLKGQYMGIHAYENYIQKISDEQIKRELQKIQQELKNDASKVAERIQNLGGKPADSEGIVGSIQGYLNHFTIPNDTSEMLEDALNGENKGIQMAKEIVRGDLDPESLQLIKELLNKDRSHVERLRGLIQ